MKIGIPRGLFSYKDELLWISFFKYLNIEVLVSPKTTKEIIKLGEKFAPDEMCLSSKIYIGHVYYIKDKVDYVLIPRIDNYGLKNQTCTNFLAMYDIINNLFDINILNYNINLEKGETELKGLISISKKLNIKKSKVKSAYRYAKTIVKEQLNKDIIDNINKLKSNKKKILLVGHIYNIKDEMIGKTIIDLLSSVEVIYSDLIQECDYYKKYSKNLYWKYSKDSLNGIGYFKDKVDGIIFLTTFPCGLDSLVNEVVIKNLNIPYLNIIIDNLFSITGIETRIESFLDIINKEVV